MRLLALDIGKKRTGIAFVDTENNIPLPLDTIVTSSVEDMIERVVEIGQKRQVDRVIVGLPLLPSGDEGEQSRFVRDCGALLEAQGLVIQYMDERYTTSKERGFDGDARAACSLLFTYLHL